MPKLNLRAYDANSSAVMRTAGANAQFLPMDKALAGLKEHQLNAFLTSGDGGAGRKLWDFLPHFTAINYAMPISIAFVRSEAFAELSEPMQREVMAAAAETEQSQFALLAHRTAENYARMLGTARLLGQTTGAALVALFLGRYPQEGTRIALLAAVGFALCGALLSMSRTVYRNANGLPNDEQVTTARDQATLGRAIQERFPRYYRYFATSTFNWRGQSIRNHNHLLGSVEGVDGIKTGYTRASGFNLVSSMRRGNRHLIGVVLGGRSGGSRDAIMSSIRTMTLSGLLALVAATAAPAQQRPPIGPYGSPPDAMIFYVAHGPAGACGLGCSDWIAAEGTVQWDSYKRLIAILDRQAGHKLPLVIHSWGGSNLNVAVSMRVMWM